MPFRKPRIDEHVLCGVLRAHRRIRPARDVAHAAEPAAHRYLLFELRRRVIALHQVTAADNAGRNVRLPMNTTGGLGGPAVHPFDQRRADEADGLPNVVSFGVGQNIFEVVPGWAGGVAHVVVRVDDRNIRLDRLFDHLVEPLLRRRP
jgi:hypothetical protein